MPAKNVIVMSMAALVGDWYNNRDLVFVLW